MIHTLSREQQYELVGIPKKFWDLKPLPFIKRKKALVEVWEDFAKAVSQTNSRGSILESSQVKVRTAFSVAFLKYYTARSNWPGKWIYFPDLLHMIGSTRFDYNAWQDYIDFFNADRFILVVDNMDASRLVDMNDYILRKLYDLFYKLFETDAKVLINTSNSVDMFESRIGPELTGLMTANLTVWGKL